MSAKKKKEGRVYTISLRDVFKEPKTKRASKAAKMVKNFLSQHVGGKIKLDGALNEELWKKGREAPPRKIKVKVEPEGDKLRATLAK